MRTVRRLGLHASRCFVSMKYVEEEASMPETTADVETSSLYPYEEGTVSDRAIMASKRMAAAFGLPVPKEVRSVTLGFRTPFLTTVVLLLL